MEPPSQGRFVWHELRTTDPAAAEEFFGKLLGWRIVSKEHGYRLIHVAGSDIGGIRELDPDADIAPHWIGHVTVDALDPAIEKVAALGGELIEEIHTIAGVGRFVAVRDPAGAVLSLYEPQGHPPPEPTAPVPPGAICWNELLTDDPEGALRYYRELLGWEIQDYDFKQAGKYIVFRRGDHDAAGMMEIPKNSPHPPHWLTYMRTEDVDAAAEKVVELNGWVLIPPMDLPQVGRVSIAADPQGGLFALFKKAPPPKEEEQEKDE